MNSADESFFPVSRVFAFSISALLALGTFKLLRSIPLLDILLMSDMISFGIPIVGVALITLGAPMGVFVGTRYLLGKYYLHEGYEKNLFNISVELSTLAVVILFLVAMVN